MALHCFLGQFCCCNFSYFLLLELYICNIIFSAPALAHSFNSKSPQMLSAHSVASCQLKHPHFIPLISCKLDSFHSCLNTMPQTTANKHTQLLLNHQHLAVHLSCHSFITRNIMNISTRIIHSISVPKPDYHQLPAQMITINTVHCISTAPVSTRLAQTHHVLQLKLQSITLPATSITQHRDNHSLTQPSIWTSNSAKLIVHTSHPLLSRTSLPITNHISAFFYTASILNCLHPNHSLQQLHHQFSAADSIAPSHCKPTSSAQSNPPPKS